MPYNIHGITHPDIDESRYFVLASAGSWWHPDWICGRAVFATMAEAEAKVTELEPTKPKWRLEIVPAPKKTAVAPNPVEEPAIEIPIPKDTPTDAPAKATKRKKT